MYAALLGVSRALEGVQRVRESASSSERAASISSGATVDKEPNKRVRKTKTTRQREIAEATLRLVAKHGVGGATVSRIAAEVGLSRGALYRHFRSREEVLFAAMDLMEERASSWITRSWDADVFRHLNRMVDSHASWAASERDTFVRPVFKLVASSDDLDITRPMAERQLLVVAALIDLVEEGKRQGSIREDVPSEDVAWGVLMFGWAQDYGRLQGVGDLSEGPSVRNLKRLLACFRTEGIAPPEIDES